VGVLFGGRSLRSVFIVYLVGSEVNTAKRSESGVHYEIEEHLSQVFVHHPGAFYNSPQVGVNRGHHEGRDPNRVIEAALCSIIDHANVIISFGDIKEGCKGGDGSVICHIASVDNLLELGFNQRLRDRITVPGLRDSVAGRRSDKEHFHAISGQKEGIRRPTPKEGARPMRPIPPSGMRGTGDSISGSRKIDPSIKGVLRGAISAVKPVRVHLFSF